MLLALLDLTNKHFRYLSIEEIPIYLEEAQENPRTDG